MAFREYVEIIGLCALGYMGNVTLDYLGGRIGLSLQSSIFGEDSAKQRAEHILDLAKRNPYAPERFFFVGMEAAALEYLTENP